MQGFINACKTVVGVVDIKDKVAVLVAKSGQVLWKKEQRA